jgi:hypothetical protein
VRHIGPAVSSVHASGVMPWLLTRPMVGLSPAIPLNAAGSRTEQPVSVPIAPAHSLAATAAPEPPLEPPGVRPVSHGLRAAP